MAGSAASLIRHEAQSAREHLIVALDMPDLAEARALVRQLGDDVSFYKIGWHLFAKGLADFIEDLVQDEKHVFLDFKSVDIGETMRGMISSVSRLGVEFITVMGTAATTAAKEGRQGRSRPKILTVTLLTDHGEEEMWREYNNAEQSVEDFVAERAVIAAAAGADGVIASAQEVAAIRRAVPRPDFLIVTPGIRPAGSAADDQRRVATPRDAIAAGANYLVVGRPILRADDKLGAAHAILAEIQTVLDRQG
jgi:orotidine-5'-phosphate decarboxylase